MCSVAFVISVFVILLTDTVLWTRSLNKKRLAFSTIIAFYMFGLVIDCSTETMYGHPGWAKIVVPILGITMEPREHMKAGAMLIFIFVGKAWFNAMRAKNVNQLQI